jgi:hypothetical protein
VAPPASMRGCGRRRGARNPCLRPVEPRRRQRA